MQKKSLGSQHIKFVLGQREVKMTCFVVICFIVCSPWLFQVQSNTYLSNYKILQGKNAYYRTSTNPPYTFDWIKMWNDTYYNGGGRIVIDSNDNIFQVGIYDNNSINAQEISLNKIANNGSVLWTRKVAGPNADYGVDIALDTQDGIYLTGTMDYDNIYKNSTIATIKYDTNGNQIWLKRSDRYNTGRTTARGIATDSLDNIYTIGTIDSFPRNATLLKYNSTGYSIWNITIDGNLNEIGNDVAVDSSNNVYIVGKTQSFIENATIIKFNDNGVQLLNFTYFSNENPQAERIFIDSNDRIYVTGTYTAENRKYLIRYDINGNFLWNYSFPLIPNFFFGDLTIDLDGNVYVIGYDEDLMRVYMFASNGSLLWNDTWDNYGISFAQYNGIAIDSERNIFISGKAPDESYREKYVLIRYSVTQYNPIQHLGEFVLSTDADTPDIDGRFHLTWTSSENAKNYSIYSYNSLITVINGSVNLLANQNGSSPFDIEEKNGEYFYIIVAYNDYESKLSNSIYVMVELQTNAPDSIPSYEIWILSLCLITMIPFLSWKYLRKK